MKLSALSLKNLEALADRKFSAAEVLCVRVVQIPSKEIVRVVRGPLASVIHLNYDNASLDTLQVELSFALNELGLSSLNEKLMIYRGSNHLDLVVDGEGSLGWLSISDNHH